DDDRHYRHASLDREHERPLFETPDRIVGAARAFRENYYGAAGFDALHRDVVRSERCLLIGTLHRYGAKCPEAGAEYRNLEQLRLGHEVVARQPADQRKNVEK